MLDVIEHIRKGDSGEQTFETSVENTEKSKSNTKNMRVWNALTRFNNGQREIVGTIFDG